MTFNIYNIFYLFSNLILSKKVNFNFIKNILLLSVIILYTFIAC